MNLQARLAAAVRQFWQTRARQDASQDARQGKHLDAFVQLVREVLIENGLPVAIHTGKDDVVVPGFFRPTKAWDLLVIHDKRLLALVEFKSQITSIGNNWNSRVEEALGNAIDIRTAYRAGAFTPSPPPWLGYFMLLQQVSESTKLIAVKEPHFPVLCK